MTLLIFCAGLLIGCYAPPLLAKLFTLGEPKPEHRHCGCNYQPPQLNWREILELELGPMPPVPAPRSGRHAWPSAKESVSVNEEKE